MILLLGWVMPAAGGALEPAPPMEEMVELDRLVAGLEFTILNWYQDVTGLEMREIRDAGHEVPLSRYLGNLTTGSAIEPADVELFIGLRQAIIPRHIFVVGNAWGFSTLMLSYIFRQSSVDVIDAEVAGKDSMLGTEITRVVAAAMGANVSVFVGFSPQHTSQAMRVTGPSYELAFIDGFHTNAQAYADFMAILPHLAERAVVVFHDVKYADLELGVWMCLCADPALRFAFFKGRRHQSKLGTGFMYRGFRDADFADLHDLTVPYSCTTMGPSGQRQVCMSPPEQLGNNFTNSEMCTAGIRNDRVCCPKACGQCGSQHCDTRPGGAFACCGGSIRATCHSAEGPPPCIYRESHA